MNVLQKMFYKSSRHEKKVLYSAYIINLIIINIFIMIGSQTSMVNDTLSESDYAQMIAIFSSMAVISTIVIIFFQWIISKIFIALYESRRDANINFRLIGITNKQLSLLYFKEYILMNIISIPIGTILSILSFYGIAIILTLKNYIIPLSVLIWGIGIHFVATGVSFFMSYFKNNKNDLISQLRTSDKSNSVAFTLFDYVSVICSILIALIPFIVAFLSYELVFRQLSMLLFPVSLVISYRFIMKLIYIFICFVSKKMNMPNLLFSSFMCSGELKKIVNSCIMLMLSCALFLGLQYFYTTVRTNTTILSDQNLHFSARLYKEAGYFTNNEIERMHVDSKNASFALYFTSEEYGRIIGVDSVYFKEYETTSVNKLKTLPLDLQSDFDKKDFSGIILVDQYITNDDLGNTIKTNFDDIAVEFIVSAGYAMNIFDKRPSYVSRSYLEDSIQREGVYNMIFLKEPLDAENIPNGAIYETQDEVVAASANKVIQSTEVIDFFSLVILLCAIVAFINHAAIGAKRSNVTIAKMRGMGIRIKNIKKILFLVATMPTAISILLAYPIACLIVSVGGNIMVGEYHMILGISTIPYLFLGVFIAIIAINIICNFVFTRGILHTDRYIQILRDSE